MENVSQYSEAFGGASGRWATARLWKALKEGRPLSAKELRTLDTLRHDEWKFFDQALLKAAVIRLVGVADLINAGLTKPVPNALGKMVFAYEKITDMDPASVSLDGLLARTDNDRQEFSLNQIALPIIHKDFFLNLRTLSASRESGEPLDTTQVGTAGRVVSEKAEKLLFQGGPTFGGLPMYGYTTHPDRNTDGFDGGKDWDDATKSGASYLADVINMLKLATADRAFGPYMIYVPSAAGVRLEDDFKANTMGTIRQRIEAVSGILGVRVADQLPENNVLMVQMTMDTAAWVQGETLQTVQWDEAGGFKINFKAFMIGAPLIRSDYAGRSGIVHLS